MILLSIHTRNRFHLFKRCLQSFSWFIGWKSCFYGFEFHAKGIEAYEYQSTVQYGLFRGALSSPCQEEFKACLIFKVIAGSKGIFYYLLAFIMLIILFSGFAVASFSKLVTLYFGQSRLGFQLLELLPLNSSKND